MKKILLVLTAAMLTACSTPRLAVDYYVLSAPVSAETTAQRSGLRIAIAPVQIPSYLARPQIVMRAPENVSMKINDSKRWGENLADGIGRVLATTLTIQLAPEQGIAAPLQIGTPADMRIFLVVQRFEGIPNGQCQLDAVWSIQKDGRNIHEEHFQKSADAGADEQSLVLAQSLLVQELAKNMAQVVVSLK